MANSAYPDQFASSEANWSGSTLFAKAGHIQVQQDQGSEPLISGLPQIAMVNWPDYKEVQADPSLSSVHVIRFIFLHFGSDVALLIILHVYHNTKT